MLDLKEWNFVNDFTIPVLPHDLSGANKLRIILDRPGLAKHTETGQVLLGYSMLIEAWRDERKISEERTTETVQDIHAENPQASIVAVALNLFPDSKGNPMKMAPEPEPEETLEESQPMEMQESDTVNQN